MRPDKSGDASTLSRPLGRSGQGKPFAVQHNFPSRRAYFPQVFSYPHNRCLAVVPAYNEEASITSVIESLRAHAPDFDVLVIDDGSTDRTCELAEKARARVLRLPFNLGIGGAVQAGFTFALEHGYDRMVQVDGDGQHDAREIHRLMTAMADDASIDVVCGSRFLTADHRYPAPISRRTGIHIFAFILSRIMGQRVSDPTSGFRMYNARAISLFARDYPHDYPEVEAVLMVHHHRLRIVEVPVRMFQRNGGVSSISNSGKPLYYMVKVLLALFVGLARSRPVPEPGDAAPVAAEQGI
jgi:glycosyltransferase involved in cell wall biosynthesis